MSHPVTQWKECDRDGGGLVLFIEFCDWAIKKNLDLKDYDNEKITAHKQKFINKNKPKLIPSRN